MSDEVLEKIRYLCRIISMVEWSGILLYETVGTIQKPDEMVINLKDIILMNKGSQAYTEYSFTEKKRDQSGYSDRHIDYCEENEEALEWQIGHIHSHNNMKVFFSGTDMSELDDNSPSHNFYLSLIVNNAMDFMAKVSFVATAEIKQEANFTALDENGNEYVISTSTLKAKKEKLYIYDCAIQSNLDEVVPDNFFLRNIKDVLQEAERPKYTAPKTATSNPTPVVTNKPFQTHPSTVAPTTQAKNPNWDWRSEDLDDDFDISGESETNEDIELFCSCLLNGTNPPDEETTFESLLLQFKMLEVSGDEIAVSALENIFPLFEKFYEDHIADEKVFIEVVEEVVEFLEEYETRFTLLSPVIMGLKRMTKEFINQTTQLK